MKNKIILWLAVCLLALSVTTSAQVAPSAKWNYLGKRVDDTAAGSCSLSRASYVYYNTTTSLLRVCNGSAWANVAGAGGGDALTTGTLGQFASTTSAQLAGVISDETGTGLLVYNTSPTLVTPILGTPTSVTLTNATGLPVSTGISGLGTNVASWLATPSSSNFASAITDETGTGSIFLGTGGTLTGPLLESYTVATLPTAVTKKIAVVTDGASASDCTSGGGSTIVLCRYNGSAWASLGGGGGGGSPGGSDTHVQFNSSGSFAGNSSFIYDNTNNILSVVGGNPGFSLSDTSGAANNFRIRMGGATDDTLDIYSVTNSRSLFRVLDGGAVSGGQVGIGPNSIPLESTLFISNAATNGTNVDARSTSASYCATFDAQTSTYASEFRSTYIQSCGASIAGTILSGVNKANSGGLTFSGLTGVIRTDTSDPIIFGTNSVERARINASGSLNITGMTSFPGSPATGDIVIITDDSTVGACDSGAGSAVSICRYSGSAWVKLGDGTSGGGALSSTDIDTSAEIATIVTDETGSGSLVLATSPTLTTPKVSTSINDTNGNEVIKTPATASAVNEITVTNAATGSGPTISATGGDTDVDLNIAAKGAGAVKIGGTSATGVLGLLDTDQTHYLNITPGSNLTADRTLTVTTGDAARTLTLTGDVTLPAGNASLTVASGTSALGTSAISSATCATVVTTAATGTATTDVVWWGFNGDPTAVTGYTPATAGMLTIIAYPSANNVNFKVCNNTSSSVTPGAITLNWRIVR